ncbi:OmpA family protein [uncultured Sphingomonas sp.]|uniref:OmpA family protein n=1 Tax=uncultured Sphingomonas sp. TaxID=158754 RepID=UPI0035CA94CA
MAGATGEKDMKTKIILAALVAATGVAAMPAVAQDRFDFGGGRPDGPEYRLFGAGVPMLDAPLRETGRGRAFVMRNFDFDHDGRIDPREADAANRAFERFAGDRRDRFDWDAHDRGDGPGPDRDGRGPRPDRVVVVEQSTTYDRGAMRGYGFRQTPRGAAMTLSGDVLFQTDSDVLRPGAIDRLRPLAGYLRANPGTRVAIDGYTDARGSDAHNQALSERRAASVQSAFDAMGVTRARFAVDGHGERDPVASNATSEGQRLNRRVEVTLLGQRADRF